jgi:hypothetical protein
MRREAKPSTFPPAMRGSSVDITAVDDTALVTVTGLVDERFGGFGDLTGMRTVVA